MTTLHEELIEKISRLTEDQMLAVYEFIRHMEDGMTPRYYTPFELMQLSEAERQRILEEEQVDDDE